MFELGGEPRSACAARVDLASVMAQLGLNERARFILERNLKRCNDLGLSEFAAYTHANLGLVHLRLGELAVAQSHLERVYVLSGQQAAGALNVAARIYESEILRAEGQLERSLESAELSGTHSTSMLRLSKEYEERARMSSSILTKVATYATWFMIAGLIISVIFRLAFFYLNTINSALEGF